MLRSGAECSDFCKRDERACVLQRYLMLPVLPCRVNTELGLVLTDVCRIASGHRGEKGCGKELGTSLASQGLWTPEFPSPFLPSYLQPGRFTEHNWVYLCAGSSFCLSFCCVIRSSYRKVWITGEKAKKIPKSKKQSQARRSKARVGKSQRPGMDFSFSFGVYSKAVDTG